MLHELLVTLSGHSSLSSPSQQHDQSFKELLSPSEKILVDSIARLGSLQSEIHGVASSISNSHESIVCRAVATRVKGFHLAAFQRDIVSIENGILAHDSQYVGAYDIVPLTGIAGPLNKWTPILDWLKTLLVFVQGKDSDSPNVFSKGRSGAQVIDWLRKESHTGYPDVEQVVLDLVKTAESTWIRMISAWTLYGYPPAVGAEDFFIQGGSNPAISSVPSYIAVQSLAPSFVTSATAESILFIGKALCHASQRGSQYFENGIEAEIKALRPSQLALFSSLEYPISCHDLDSTVRAIRNSLTQRVLHKLLSVAALLQFLDVLHGFLLLQRNDFASALIDAADQHLSNRHLKLGPEARQGGSMIQASELLAILSKAWTSFMALQTAEDVDDEQLDIARDHVRLSIKQPTSNTTNKGLPEEFESVIGAGSPFEDALLGMPCVLDIQVPSPQDIFLTTSEISLYSTIHAYLLSLRRIYVHLSQLWRLSGLRRRCRSSPAELAKLSQQGASSARRIPLRERDGLSRGAWATVSSVTFFFAELISFLQGEVVSGSWHRFRYWIMQTSQDKAEIPWYLSDPEFLAKSHKAYLYRLLGDLFLADKTFVTLLRALMSRCDHMIALMGRLAVVSDTISSLESGNAGTVHGAAPSYRGKETSKSSMQHSASDERVKGNDAVNQMWDDPALAHAAREELDLLKDLSGIRAAIEEGLQQVVSRLRDADKEKAESSGGGDVVSMDLNRADKPHRDGFDTTVIMSPWKDDGVERLLFRLNFGLVGAWA